MKILVACEESQVVTIELRKLGHEAYSCDIQPCSGGHPEWHLQQDVLSLLNEKWDMIIAFPPCTYLSKVGAVCLFDKHHNIKDKSRFERGLEAKEFFMKIYNSAAPRIAIENPTPMKIFKLPQPDCIINPYDFGHPYSKRTCLWLKGLPPLFSTSIYNKYISTTNAPWFQSFSGAVRQKNRSKTFQGVAQAMAQQWG